MISRRRFLQSSVSLALVPLLPKVALSADLRVRPSWETFCTGPMYQPYCDAIATMRANHSSTDPNGWPYWAETHRQFCPHDTSYFLAWHRGFIYRFEGRIRKLSGQPDMVLPYWNYYNTPTIPPEFLDSSSPLYRSDRTGTDVTGALGMDAYADTILHFQRGKTDAFEPLIEASPHNPVHNLIGGVMSAITYSPKDPLFFVHHANIDRLWAAWINAGGGRHQPIPSNTYWQGDLEYGTALKAIPRVWTTNTTTYFNYQYDDLTLPSAPADPPPSGSVSSAVAFSIAGALLPKPAAVQTTALGAPCPLTLDERSVSVDVPLTSQDANRVRSLMLQPASASASTDASPLRVVLDGVHLTALGRKGGYFYKVFINLPDQAGVNQPERAYLIGMVGAFEITVAQMKVSMQGSGMQGMQGMHAAHDDPDVTLVFPLTEALQRIWPTSLDKLTVSFVRVDGARHPARGNVVKVRDFRVEADSTM